MRIFSSFKKVPSVLFVTAALLVLPVAGSAQAITTNTPNPSPAGVTTYSFAGSSKTTNPDFSNSGGVGRYAGAVTQDALANGPAGYPNYCIRHYNPDYFSPGPVCGSGSFSGPNNKYPDSFYTKANGGNPTGPPTTANRLCTIADNFDAQQAGYAPDLAVTATNIGNYQFAGNNDENTLIFNGSRWLLIESAPKLYIPGYVGTSPSNIGDINDAISGLTCKSFALPQPTLYANTYTVSNAGDSVALTFGDLPYSDNIPNGGNVCTATGFTVPTTSERYCADYQLQCDGNQIQAAADLAMTDGGSCTRVCDDYETNQVPDKSGTITVNPTETTTYSYSCTNPNGTTKASVTINVPTTPPPAVPTVKLTAAPPSIASGESSKLTWVSTDATSCTGSGFDAGGAPNNSSGVSVSPDSTTTYGITCTGAGGQATSYADVNVTGGPLSVRCSALPASTVTGKPVTWLASASGANGTYAYSWSGTNLDGNTTSSVQNSYASAGTYSGTVTVSSGAASKTASCGSVVIAPASPDLVAGAVSPTSAVAGTAATFTASVTNSGTGPTGSGFTNKLQYATAYDSGTDTATGVTDVGTAGTPSSLADSASATASFSYTFPATDAGTTRFLRVCADIPPSPNGVIAESDETNNCGAWTAVTVTPTTPLLGCTLSGSGSGATLTLSWTSTNAVSGGIDQGVGTVSPIATGSVDTAYPDADTTYTMSVHDAAGNGGTCTATVPGGPGCDPTVTSCGGCTASCCGPTCGPSSPSVSCTRSPSGSSLSAPVTLQFTAVPQNGAVAPYTFKDALGAILQSGSALTFSKTFSSAGSYAVTVSASNASGPYSCGSSFTVTGGGPNSCSSSPSGKITATPSRVQAGDSVHLAWTASGVQNSCSVTGPGLTPVTTAGTPACSVTGPGANPVVNTQSTYVLTCDGTEVDRVTVNILPSFVEF